MTLYLLRHSLALPLGARGIATDEERFLSDEGRALGARTARGIQALGLEFDQILTSPLVRARQTAEIVAKILGAQERLKHCDVLRPGMKPKRLLDWTAEEKKARHVLCVGHQPDLGAFISYAVWKIKQGRFSFSECSLAGIELGEETNKLRLLLTGERLAQLGERRR